MFSHHENSIKIIISVYRFDKQLNEKKKKKLVTKTISTLKKKCIQTPQDVG